MKNCIVLVTDDGYEDMTKMCLYSLLENIKNVDILLYVDGAVAPYREFENSIKVIHIDYKLPIIHKVNKALTVNNIDLISHRIRILDKLKYVYNKILLLDTDTLIIDDFSEIFNYDDEHIYGNNTFNVHNSFVKSLGIKPLVNSSQPDFYFNCGVCLLPSKQLKKFNLVAEYLKDLYVNSVEYVCPEQDFLNHIFDNKVDLTRKYNYMLTNVGEFNSKIIHYVSNTKPLNVDLVSMILDFRIYLIYFEYLEKYRNKISKQFYNKINEKIECVKKFIETNNIKSVVRF